MKDLPPISIDPLPELRLALNDLSPKRLGLTFGYIPREAMREEAGYGRGGRGGVEGGRRKADEPRAYVADRGSA